MPEDGDEEKEVKTCEQNNGSPEDVKKVEGMMPIVTKKRHVDQETGQMVEGLSALFTCSLLFLTLLLCSSFFQTGTLYLQTTSANRILRLSSSCKWHIRGSRPRRVHLGHLARSDDDDSDGAGEVANERVQRPGGGGNDENVSSSEDEGDDWRLCAKGDYPGG